MLSLTNKANVLAKHINIKWHTLAKCNWIRHEGANNKFYPHWVTFRMNYIKQLKLPNDIDVHNLTLIKEAFQTHYNNLWSEGIIDPILSNENKEIIANYNLKLEENKWQELCNPFTVKEIIEEFAKESPYLLICMLLQPIS